MADYYVWSGASASASPFAGWDTAALTLAAAVALATTAGDRIYVASDHSETTNATVTLTFSAGTAAAPILVLGGTRSGTSGSGGITALAAGAIVSAGTGTQITVSGKFYIYGVRFTNTSNSTTTFNMNYSSSSDCCYDNCEFYLAGTGTSSRIKFGWDASSGSSPLANLRNCGFRLSSASQSVHFNSHVLIQGGSIMSGSSSPTTFCSLGPDGRGGRLEIDGFDFSVFGTGFNIIGGTTSGAENWALIRNVKMPTGWTGSVASAPAAGANRYELYNYAIGAGDTNYKFKIVDSFGNIEDSTSIYRDAGAMDESTHISWKMTTPASAVGYALPLRSPLLSKRVAAAAGVGKTATIHVVHDAGAALTDKELWIELSYPGTAGSSNYLQVNDRANAITAAVAQAASTETWTGTGGFGTVQKVKVHVTALTFEEAGSLCARVCLAKAGVTAYVDPKIEIS